MCTAVYYVPAYITLSPFQKCTLWLHATAVEASGSALLIILCASAHAWPARKQADRHTHSGGTQRAEHMLINAGVDVGVTVELALVAAVLEPSRGKSIASFPIPRVRHLVGDRRHSRRSVRQAPHRSARQPPFAVFMITMCCCLRHRVVVVARLAIRCRGRGWCGGYAGA